MIQQKEKSQSPILFTPAYPTKLHLDAAELVCDYFRTIPHVDTILVVNSCARGQAAPDSDLDFAILVKPETTTVEIKNIQYSWQIYSNTQTTFSKYKQSNQFAQLHLDIIQGHFIPAILEKGGSLDYFEIEIGNHLCYSAPMDVAGPYYHELQKRWLPYYKEELRLQRFEMIKEACTYNLDHISSFVDRKLYFQAFDTLYRAFQEYLQALFIANKTYPISYNKWIREQIEKWLNNPELYPKLSPILSVTNIESNEIIEKTKMLRELLDDLGNVRQLR
jgi:predicted nucleotidyltransferase